MTFRAPGIWEGDNTFSLRLHGSLIFFVTASYKRLEEDISYIGKKSIALMKINISINQRVKSLFHTNKICAKGFSCTTSRAFIYFQKMPF